MNTSTRALAWRELAAQLHGQLSEGALQNPSIRCQLGGYDAMVDLDTVGPSGAGPRTRLQVAQPARGLSLRLTPERLVQKLAKLAGAQDLMTGDDAFDRAFLISGSDTARVGAVLADASLRAAMLGFADLEVRLQDGAPAAVLTLSCRGVDRDAARLSAFVALAMQVVAALDV